MKWTKEEIERIKCLIEEGKNYKEISNLTGIQYNAIRVKMGKIGEGFKKHNPKITKLCVECEKEITNHGLKFCSSSCSATHNNKLKPKKEKVINEKKRKIYSLKKKEPCIYCNNITTNKFCNSSCQANYNKKVIFDKIEKGDVSLPSRQYKNYLIHKHGEKCMECGWCEINLLSGKVPIELEHIDGNSENNSLNNLKLLCPNHHSLTPTYKALNKGNGRHARMVRYNSGKSF